MAITMKGFVSSLMGSNSGPRCPAEPDAGPAETPDSRQSETGKVAYAGDLSSTSPSTSIPAPRKAPSVSRPVSSLATPVDCRRYLVLNGKGGCGKTTVSTNLASYLAVKGYKTAIMDYDPQESSLTWLKLRGAESEAAPSIHGIAAHPGAGGFVTRSWQLRIPHGTERVVIDAPAGVGGAELFGLLKDVDAVVIPVLPSSIDMHATARFIQELLLIGKVRSRNIPVGIVANRVPKKTQAYKKLLAFLGALNIPFVVQFKDNPNYLNAAEIGLGIHELRRGCASHESGQWDKLATWLEEATQNKSSVPNN